MMEGGRGRVSKSLIGRQRVGKERQEKMMQVVRDK